MPRLLYWESDGYGLPFEYDQYGRMAFGMLGGLQGHAIRTLNNHQAMRALFAQFDIECADIQYIVGGAGNTAPRSELIIYSWDRAKDPMGLF